jgi:predicted O-methyltransferase YrrM
MDYGDPFRELEPLDREIDVVEEALRVLHEERILPHTDYHGQKMLAHRRAVGGLSDTKWTAISPRMQRLLYAINAIAQPRNMIAAGIFWGNTFLSNAGAAIGPGACYEARQLVGVEINPEEAARAERNVKQFDADGEGGRGKGVYVEILKTCFDRIPRGGIVLAHDSVNAAGPLGEYLRFVRAPGNFRESVSVILDPFGLEVSVK